MCELRDTCERYVAYQRGDIDERFQSWTVGMPDRQPCCNFVPIDATD
jgi:hypothetical protein